MIDRDARRQAIADMTDGPEKYAEMAAYFGELAAETATAGPVFLGNLETPREQWTPMYPDLALVALHARTAASFGRRALEAA